MSAIQALRAQIASGTFPGLPTGGGLPNGAVRMAEYATADAALAAIPVGYALTCLVAGRRSLWANVGGALVDLLAPATY